MPYGSDDSDVCHSELANILTSLQCDPGERLMVLDIDDAQSNARQLLGGLALLSRILSEPNLACQEAAPSFLCLYFFGLCDSSGMHIQPTFNECSRIKDVCREELILVRDNFDLELPDCSSFPMEQASCPVQSASGSGSSLSGSGNTGMCGTLFIIMLCPMGHQ